MLGYHKSPITRRFVRTKAIQYLYAFYINQQANYQNALEAIKTAFIPDVFAKEPVDATQLEKEKAKALELFAAWETGVITYIPHATDKTVAYKIASKLWEDYQSNLIQETNVLQVGFKTTLDNVLDAYLLILQLVIEWFVIARRQAQKGKQLAANIPYPEVLAHNHILEALHANGAFQDLMQQRHLTWNQHMDVVGRWYNQFMKEAPLFFHDPLPTNTGDRDYKVWSIILQQIILEQEDIEHFFSILDLGWEENRPIIKKLLTNVNIANLPTITQGQTLFGASSAAFYTELISKMLEKDHQIETTMQQYTQNWSIERVVLLDRIIIKLALCEMLYLSGTPIKVIINEYVDLAKKYSTLKSGAFVNGILDTIAKKV